MINDEDRPVYAHLQIARNYAFSDCHKKAFAFYLSAMEGYPRMKPLIEFEFRIALSKVNQHLTAVENNKPEVLQNMQAAMKAFPGNADILSYIGKYLYGYSYFCEALLHFEKALEVNRSLVTVEKSMDHAKKLIFSRAHYRLLNDERRNRAYLDAIRAVVMPNAECVLDTDTGAGLSALYANACAAASTAACEPSLAVARVAQRIMAANNVQEVLVINKPATKLDLNDVYGERTMLITNKFDAGLFGDQLLQVLKHSWENLLTEYGRVVPGRAEYYVIGARCDRIARKYQLAAATKRSLRVAHLHVHTEPAGNESYYGEDVDLYDDIEYVTDPHMLLSIDFNDYYDITRKLKSTAPYKAYFTARRDTELNVVVGWFRLYLTDSVVLTTDPRSENKTAAWQQAVFFDYIPTRLKASETVCVPFYTYRGKLRVGIDSKTTITRLSQTAIAFLNDTVYMEAIARSVETAAIYLGQLTDASEFEIADLSPFPMFGMLMMKRGVKSLVSFARTAADKAFIEEVFIRNHVSLRDVTILVAEFWSHTAFKGRAFHAVFCNPLELNGDVQTTLSNILKHLRYSHLVPHGLALPASVALVAQLISSEWLDRQNRVSDAVMSAFRLASHVNLFQASQASCVDPAQLRYEALSEPVRLAESCHDMKSGASRVRVTRDGLCSGVLVWHELQLARAAAVSTRRAGSFVGCAVFLPDPRAALCRGDSVTLVRCVDCDGSYKIVMDVDIA